MTDEQTRLRESPSQTAGPYVHIGCTPNQAGIEGVYGQDLGCKDVLNSDADRHALNIRVIDGQGELVKDAMVEIWIANQNHWARRALESETGSFDFNIAKPETASDNIGQTHAPHVSIWVVARGINLGLHTRMYFPDEDNSEDFALGLVPEDRRETLIAEENDSGYQFNIHLQGDEETVFFDV